jgi:hypothetical protein
MCQYGREDVLFIIRDVIAQALKRSCSEKSRHIHFVECANTAVVDGRMSYAAQNIRSSNSLFNYSMEMCGALIIQSTVSAVAFQLVPLHWDHKCPDMLLLPPPKLKSRIPPLVLMRLLFVCSIKKRRRVAYEIKCKSCSFRLPYLNKIKNYYYCKMQTH